MRSQAALSVLFFLIVVHLSAQTGNEWIIHNQPYAKIRTASNAIYRLTAAQLEAAGFPAENASVEKLQLFHRGNEQAIVVQDDGDGVFDGSDYLEFYGLKNDGTLDQQLYSDPAFQPHNYYNLYSDTTAYFLTIGANNGKRASFYGESNSGFTTQDYHDAEKLMVLSESFFTGMDYGQVHLTTFDRTEGWMSHQLLYTDPPRDFTLTGIARTLPSLAPPTLEMVVTGRGDRVHDVDVFIGPSGRTLTTFDVRGYESKMISIPIEWTDITAGGDLKVIVKVNGEATRISVNYIKLQYAQELDMANAESFAINVPANADSKLFLQLQNFPANTRLFDITTPGNLIEIGTTTNATLDAVVRNTTSARRLFATSAVVVPTVEPVTFRQIDPNNHNYVIITHPSLQQPGGNYANPVKAFAAYRASQTGGGFDTLVVNIGDLYDQFNYGEQSPLAIFHFMKFFANTKLPEYLFIIGNGLDVFYNYYRQPQLFSTYKDLVPTAGYPGSDIAFTAGLNGATYGPAVPTGRITAMHPAEVAAYLNKVKETETRPFDDLRRKHVLHLSGGIYVGEPEEFRGYLAEIAPIAENSYLGGKVAAMAKQSTDLKLINIASEVNQGVNLVTFFGHSSPGTLDFDVGFVTDPVMDYHNKGKYPVLLMNGCDAGAFFLNAKLFGEDWINAADRGAIGFIAHSSFGFENELRGYSRLFYEVGYGDSLFITKGIGDVQKEAVQRYLVRFGTTPRDITHVQNMVLLGDPAVPLFGARYPDYAIEDDHVSMLSFHDEKVTAASDSFAIQLIVRNYGQAPNTPLKVRIKRTLPDKSVINYDSIYSAVLYADTLLFVIRRENMSAAGYNVFAVEVDADNEIEELRDDNNIAYLDHFIPLNSTLNLYPRKFSIVNTRELNLSFQHTDNMSGAREFVLELDTTNLFNSSFKQTYTITATVLALQPVQLLEHDTVAYYWRTRLVDPHDDESEDWSTSSFTYIMDGPDGWAQIHFPQFAEDDISGLVRNDAVRRISFQETHVDIRVETFGIASGASPDTVSLEINGAEYNLHHQGFGCRTNSLNLVAFNRKTTTPYIGVPFQWFNRAGRTCGREPWVINNFQPAEMVTGNGDDLIQYINNVDAGDSVVIFTIGDAAFSTWPTEALEKLGELGIAQTQIQSLLDGEAAVIFAKKGTTPGSATVMRDDGGTEGILEIQKTITGRNTYGEVHSTNIGPAISWTQLLKDTREEEATDVTYIDVIGINPDGQETVLIDSITSATDLSGIDAGAFPHIRLIFKTSDDENLTAVQLKNWIVTYESPAEGLIFYSGSTQQVDLAEGEEWSAAYDFINVSNKNFTTSVPVSFKIFNQDAHQSDVTNLTIDPPVPGDTTHFTVTVNTRGRAGLNDVEVFVNPQILPEQFYENNVWSASGLLDVSSENFNPVLDVTFDGRHIEKNEYVSKKPDIVIQLWDENPYLIKTDTTGLDISIAYPCGEEPCQFTRVYFNSPDVTWSAATDTSQFSVKFTPHDLAEGTYTLRVIAMDVTGNQSDDDHEPYVISFRVKDEQKIDISLPYPNPTADAVTFEVTVANDSEVHYNIEVFTVNGALAGRFDESNFKPLHVGHNTITIRPTDAYGQLLPAGIYIYRMVMTSAESSQEVRGKIFLTK